MAFHRGNDRDWLREPVPLQDNREQDNQGAESIAYLAKYLEAIINLGIFFKVIFLERLSRQLDSHRFLEHYDSLW